jgi:hypothetical protein
VTADGGARKRPPTVAFACESCGRAIFVPAGTTKEDDGCPGCGIRHPLRLDPAALQRLTRCQCCGLERLYVQKDFNRKLGLAVFAVAALLSVPTWGVSLLVATILDLVLYRLVGDVTICYGCAAQHRGFPVNPDHQAFDLHVAEQVDRQPRPV